MYFLTGEEVGHIVVDYLERAVAPLFATGALKRRHLAVVVAEAAPSHFEDARMFELFYNPEQLEPDYPFEDFALAKAELVWKTGMSTRDVIQLHPEMLDEGDIRYAGGIRLGGFVVAVSALDDFDDEAIAMQIAWELWRECMRKMKAYTADHFLVPRS